VSRTSEIERAERSDLGSPSQIEIEADLYQALSIDAYDVLGIERRPPLKRLVSPLFRPIGNKFASILAEFENETGKNGFQSAVKEQLPRFVSSVQSRGDEHLPSTGPLILASNHPAAYDAFLLAAALPRDDLRILATDIQLVDHMPFTREHFIFIGPAGNPDRFQRMSAVRESITHLRSGGSLLLFPSGLVDPDPAISDGAEMALERWHPSLELFLKNVPECALVMAIVSGVLSKRWLKSPVTRLRKEPHNRQKVAEAFQVIEQLLFPGRLLLDPKISYSPPYHLEDLHNPDSPTLMPILIDQAKLQLSEHQQSFYSKPT